MGKKKFIDKKKSATFQLLARDSSDPFYDDSPGNDRVFVRVDNNHSYSTDTFDGESNADDAQDSIFADAPEDCDAGKSAGSSRSLPENLRKEILELGFPDDGYNYLSHLREIKNLGGGSAFYNNPKTRLDQLPSDVKAYDASKLQISNPSDDRNDKYMYNVASETVGVRVQRALDPEVAALLNEDDLSRFGSDDEDLEEDFVIQANFRKDNEGVSANKDVGVKVQRALDPEVAASLNDDDLARFGSDVEDLEEDFVIQTNFQKDKEGVSANKDLNFHEQIESKAVVVENNNSFGHPQIVADLSSHRGFGYQGTGVKSENAVEEARVRRHLDDQFDLLESQEYGSDEDGGDDYGHTPEEGEFLGEKLKLLRKDDTMDILELDGKYRAPADLLHGDEVPKGSDILDSARDVIRRCSEYAEKYENDDPRVDVVVFEESSDESEVWDCETIVSTYSNLDNHPGKIQAPGGTRKKKLSEAVFGAVNSTTNQKIILKGREKMPVDFLPNGRKPTAEKITGDENSKTEQQKRKQHGQESKEEKKERKAAVKEERREARKAKKEMKGLFKGEAMHAQRVAATSCPSSIHLM